MSASASGKVAGVESARPRGERTLWRFAKRNVTGNGDDSDPTLADRRTNGVFQDVWQLAHVGDELAIMAALLKEILRVRLLEIATTDLSGRDLGRDRKHRHAASMRVEEPVDEMQVARPAGARTDRQIARHLGFAGGGESRNLLMPDMHPFDRAPASQRLRETVQTVAHDPVNALDAGIF